MKRIAAKILCIVCFLVTLQGYLSGQERSFRIGFQASPVFSGLRNNHKDVIVKNGGNLGLKLGAISDIYFKDNLSFTVGFNLAFHEGGEFLYEVGGNFLPESELSEPLLQTGDKPLPDGVTIRYQLQYLEFPVGLKFRTESDGNMNWFFEAPVLTFSFLTRGRGDIETDDYLYEQENISKDLVVANVFLGLGAGVEYAISKNNSLIGGLYYQRGLIDVTRDHGHIAYHNPDIIPTYITVQEDSKATIGNLILCLGILF
ncbi:MAG TPA: porin family protein [Saprospiraceae bacterium]